MFLNKLELAQVSHHLMANQAQEEDQQQLIRALDLNKLYNKDQVNNKGLVFNQDMVLVFSQQEPEPAYNLESEQVVNKELALVLACKLELEFNREWERVINKALELKLVINQ